MRDYFRIIALLIFSFAVFFIAPLVLAQETIQTEIVQPILQSDATTQSIPVQIEPAPALPSDQQQPQMPREQQINEEEFEQPRDFVDPREITDVLRQIKDVRREANRIIKRAKANKLTAEANQVNEVILQVNAIEAKIKSVPRESVDRETLQEFYDSQVWDLLNEIRMKVEFPNEIKMMERELNRLFKMLNRKSLAIEGVDIEKIKAKAEEIKNAIEQAKNHFNQGNLEEAGESLRMIHEDGVHPGEIMGMVDRLSRITVGLKKIKSQEIKDEIMEILQPVLEAANSEDYREANMLLNEIDRDLWRILNAVRSKTKMNQDLQSKIQKLEQKLQIKVMQGQNKNDLEDVKNEKQSYYQQKRRTSTFLGNVLEALLY